MTEHETLLAAKVGRGHIGVAAGLDEDDKPVVLIKVGGLIVSLPPEAAFSLADAIRLEAAEASTYDATPELRRRADA